MLALYRMKLKEDARIVRRSGRKPCTEFSSRLRIDPGRSGHRCNGMELEMGKCLPSSHRDEKKKHLGIP